VLACTIVAAACFCVAAAMVGATTAPEMILPLDVTLTAKHARFDPAPTARRGNYVQLNVMNATSSRRTFTLAARRIVIPARARRLMAIEFDVRGKYRYVSRAGSSKVVGVFRVS